MNESSLKRDLDALAERDPDVATGLGLVGYPAPRSGAHGFQTLLSIIVSQQISKEAAASIKQRVDALLPNRSAADLLALDDMTLKGAGLSRPKVAYARALAVEIAEGRFDVDALPEMSDDDAIAAITGLKGFGRWSAEIYCMFSLGRPDIFPAGDLALQEALRRLKGLPDRPRPAAARAITEPWSPWRSAASVFLWHYYRGAPQT